MYMHDYKVKPGDHFIRAVATHIVNFAKTYVVISLVLIATFSVGLVHLKKDTRADAFLADDNPALVYKEKVKQQFGLSDPVVVAVSNESENGVFNPETLKLIQMLSDKIARLPNINADRVTSLSTRKNITGVEDGMEVDYFFEDFPDTQKKADAVWEKVSKFPLYMGRMVSRDKKASMIIAEVIDETKVEDTYLKILDIIKKIKLPDNVKIYVAGEGAISGYLGSYIDKDASRLNPLAGIIITLIILYAFRRISTALLSNVIIAASVLITLGVMSLNDIPFYVITNALPVILIGMSVADSIHIYSVYFEFQAKHPRVDKKELIVSTIVDMWRPITLTSLTTIAGFIGLYFAAYMPPFKYFGLYTAFGVFIAWIYSLMFLPASLAIIKPTASRKMVDLVQNKRPDYFSKLMINLGRIVLNYPKVTITIFMIIFSIGAFSSRYIVINEDRIETFHHNEPLYQADKFINSKFDGTNNLDIVIESNEKEGMFIPENLYAMKALQKYASGLPSVKSANSIVDYLEQMNRALNGGSDDAYKLPTQRDAIAQYFLIYSASSDPTDFAEEIDYDYKSANIRVTLNKGSFVAIKPVVESLQKYIDTHFTNGKLTATLSGRVTVNYHWIKDLGRSHFKGVIISLLLVWIVSALLFRSLFAGVMAVIPVITSILLIYTSMVMMNINLGIGTSMFASVAIGLGVDFAIHTIDRLRTLFQSTQGNWDESLSLLFPSTGRALFLNYLAIAFGFGVLISSKVVPLNNFGLIVVIAVSTSFLASMSFIPALIKVIRPKFIRDEYKSIKTKSVRVKSTMLIAALAILSGTGLLPETAKAETLPKAQQIVEKINRVADGNHVTRNLTMNLIDRHGKKRTRETLTFRKYYGKDKKTIIFYQSPSNIKGTAFLTFDYADVKKDDDQWLYLPALRKVRRISASDRGDYFLGTDFTYEDIKLEGKVSQKDYIFTALRFDSVDNRKVVVLKATPKTDTIAKELGYGKIEYWVDVDNYITLKAIFWDIKGRKLKTLRVTDIDKIDGFLTRHRMFVMNHQTGHSSEFLFSHVDYKKSVGDRVFTKRAMKKGK